MGLFIYIALAIAIGAGFLTAWFIAKRVSVKWYEWLLGWLGVLGLIALTQHSFATFLEREAQAFGPGLVLFGIPSIIVLAVVGQLIWRRHRKSA